MLEPAFRGALLSLVHELYFKSSHFRGASGEFSRNDHNSLNERFLGSGWLQAGSDPVSELLREVAVKLHGRSDPSRTDAVVEGWERAESTINARLRALCDLCGPKRTSNVLKALVPAWDDLPPLNAIRLREYFSGKRVDSLYGQPDLLLAGGDSLVTIEMKVRGAKSCATYDADQHFKYLRLSADARRRGGGPARTYHLVTAPLGGQRVAKHPDKWLTAPLADGAAIEFCPEGLASLIRPTRARWLQDQGGAEWLRAAVAAVPARFVEFGRLIDGFSTAGTLSEHPEDVARQVGCCRRFGLAANPDSRGRRAAAA